MATAESFSTEFAELLLEIPNGAVVAPDPAGWAVKLYSTLFSNGSATELTGGSAPGYAPALVPASNLGFDTANGWQTKNSTPILFPVNSSTTTSWATAVAVAIGKPSAGSSALPAICAYGKLDTGWATPPGDRLRYPISRFVITMLREQDNHISEEFANGIASIFAGAALQSPNFYYVGLGKDDPTNEGEIGEIPQLARVPIACAENSWVAGPTLRTRQNNLVLEYAEAPAGLPKIRSFGLFTTPRAAGAAPGEEKPHWHGKTVSEKIVYFEDIVVILTGGIVIGL